MISFSFGLHISSYFVKIHIEMSKIYKFLSTFIIFSYLYKQLCALFSGNSTFKYQLNNGKDEICIGHRSVKRYWKSRGFTTSSRELILRAIKSSGMEADKTRNWVIISLEYPNL